MSEHLQAINLLTRGNPDRAGFTRPTLGSVISATLEKVDTKIPNYVLLDPNPKETSSRNIKRAIWPAGWARNFSPVRLGGAYTQLGHGVDAHAQTRRSARPCAAFLQNITRTSGTARRPPRKFRLRKGQGPDGERGFVRPGEAAREGSRALRPGSFGLHSLMARNLRSRARLS